MTTATRTCIEEPVQFRAQVLPLPLQCGVGAALIHELAENHTEGWITREITRLFDRHMTGDWGELDEHDCRMNEQAVRTGDRVLSRYTIDETAVYVITEAGHEILTMIRVRDY